MAKQEAETKVIVTVTQSSIGQENVLEIPQGLVRYNEDCGEKLSPADPSMFPDGGIKAWLCVAGGAACFFSSFGWINCIGIFQDYYKRVPLHDHSASAIGWIPSLEIFCMLFFGPFVGKYFDNHGPCHLMLAGTFLHVFGLVMTSFSTEYYQFLVSQGICSAIGASMIFNPAMACVSTWFYRKRGLAVGCMAAGSSLGGIIFPIIVSQLVPKVGFAWTMRVCALIILILMGFANMTLTSRLLPSGKAFDWTGFVRPLHEPSFLAITLAIFFFHYGMFLPFSFIVTDASRQGMSLSLAQYLVSIINAGSIFGRVLPGYIGDRVGRFNTMIVCCTLTGVLILAVWIPASKNLAFILFSPFFGFASGAAIGLLPVLISQISDVKDIGVRTGTVFGISSIAALTGTPIGGALVGVGSEAGYTHMKIFSGVFCSLGAVFFIIARVSLGGFNLRRKI